MLSAWALAARADLDCTVVDVAKGMMAHVPDGVGTVLASAEELPFSASTIDAVMMGEALHHFRNSDHALEEVARVLRAGGRLWVYDFDPTRGVGRWVHWGERLAGEPASFYRPADLAARLDELGFEVEYECRKGQYVLTATRRV